MFIVLALIGILRQPAANEKPVLPQKSAHDALVRVVGHPFRKSHPTASCGAGRAGFWGASACGWRGLKPAFFFRKIFVAYFNSFDRFPPLFAGAQRLGRCAEDV
jgi:hypothetical protein